MADIVLPILVHNGDDGPGLDDDCSVSDGAQGDLADFEGEDEEVVVAVPDDLPAVVQQLDDLQAWQEAEIAAGASSSSSAAAIFRPR